MKLMPPEMLYRYNYSLHPINSLRQYWCQRKTFSCINEPKQHNIFVFLNGCSASYTDKHGKTVQAEAGDLIYAPEGMEYTARFYDFKDKDSCTVGINFRLFDEENLPIIFEKEIKVYRNGAFRELVAKIDNADRSTPPCFAVMKSGIYDIISILGSTQNVLDKKYKVIEKGIECMESGDFSISIEEIAATCHVSDAYFRRLFKEYSGLSPIEYRMQMKINKAKYYLSKTSLNSTEIADLLFRGDTSFFCRHFKASVGMTPEKFRGAYKSSL